MIRHVVLLTWTAEATDEQKQRIADELRALPPKMSGLSAYQVGPDARIVDGNADFAIVADFDDVPSYLAYREHPAHRAVIDQFVIPIAARRVSAQYEV